MAKFFKQTMGALTSSKTNIGSRIKSYIWLDVYKRIIHTDRKAFAAEKAAIATATEH